VGHSVGINSELAGAINALSKSLKISKTLLVQMALDNMIAAYNSEGLLNLAREYGNSTLRRKNK
jgi:hypothetical protein